jgi:hypothetical protein
MNMNEEETVEVEVVVENKILVDIDRRLKKIEGAKTRREEIVGWRAGFNVKDPNDYKTLDQVDKTIREESSMVRNLIEG